MTQLHPPRWGRQPGCSGCCSPPEASAGPEGTGVQEGCCEPPGAGAAPLPAHPLPAPAPWHGLCRARQPRQLRAAPCALELGATPLVCSRPSCQKPGATSPSILRRVPSPGVTDGDSDGDFVLSSGHQLKHGAGRGGCP